MRYDVQLNLVLIAFSVTAILVVIFKLCSSYPDEAKLNRFFNSNLVLKVIKAQGPRYYRFKRFH